MINDLSQGIGGYLNLELPRGSNNIYPNSIRFQSARAAFAALLNSEKPKRVWMPKYICDSMLSPLYALGIEIKFYEINLSFKIAETLTIEKNDWLLYVNYFGLCSSEEERLMKLYKPSQLIFDHSQAFFSHQENSLATIYSPRKFFGLPDGGLLVTTMHINEPKKIDEASSQRCTHLLKRLGGKAEDGYQDYLIAETSLREIEPKRMSYLTNCLLSRIDLNFCSKQRINNFNLLHQYLGRYNRFKFLEIINEAPMCYPFFVQNTSLRSKLLSNRIFVATYWEEVKQRATPESAEIDLVENCIPLPCDQRYDDRHMIKIVEIIEKYI